MPVDSPHMPGGDSQQPFATVLRALMEYHGYSLRRLAARTREVAGDDGIRPTYINALTLGRLQPTPRNMEVLAQALGEDPRVFLEYRQHLVRVRAAELADELARELDLDVILDALDRLKTTLTR